MKLIALQLLLWHSALWTVQEATPLAPAGSLPPSFLLKCLEQVRKIQADGTVLQERLVSERGKQRLGLEKEDLKGIAEGEREPQATIRKGPGRGETGRKGSTLVEVELHEAGKPLGKDNPMGTVLGGPGWDGRAGQWGSEASQDLEVRRTSDGEDLGRRSGLSLSSPLTRHPSCLQCTTHKLCHPEELALLGHSLGIPQASLSSCSSQALQLMGCLSQFHSGLFLYQGLLQALAGISPELAPTLDTLQLDVTDFATYTWQQMEDLGMAPAAQPTQGTLPTFTSAFQRRAGGVLVASNLQNFLELAYRVLRHLAKP
ncbi:hypothetical protein MC885_000409 [Smutsia gigantea]|nr:hypothetical protein MC885_000409 [Smutsia gigantea]